MHTYSLWLVSILIIIAAHSPDVIYGYTATETAINKLLTELRQQPNDAVLIWNLVAVHACANDYNTEIVAKPDQPGPTATSRALAIIHGAMHDALMAYDHTFSLIFAPLDFFSSLFGTDFTTKNAAIMEAAYQTLRALYPAQTNIFYAALEFHSRKLNTDFWQEFKFTSGRSTGDRIARYMLEERQYDGSTKTKTYTPNETKGYHREDPTHPNQGFFGVHWGDVKPFFLDFASQFRPSNIVGTTVATRAAYLNSSQYVNDFNEILTLGGRESAVRTADQTEIGSFWGYDGAAKIGTPPRLYNQVVRVIAIQQRNTLLQNARLFALVNYALADAGIACWESKYFYALWRPILGVRAGSDATSADPKWVPLGAGKNDASDNFTPSFPSYVSGHSTFGSACFEILRLFYKKDNITFSFQSDEYNGKTIDSVTGLVRPEKTRQYQSFSQAETENYLSRIYLGVHWRIDQEEGRILGRKVAQHVFKRSN